MVVHGRERECRRDRSVVGAYAAIADHKNPAPGLNCVGGGATEIIDCPLERGIAARNGEERGHCHR